MKEIWKIGKDDSVVVSNIKVRNDNSGHNEVDYYGGYLVCGSIATKEYAELISSTLKMKEMLNYFINGVEGGIEKVEGSVISGYTQTFGIAMLKEAKRIVGRND